MMHYRNDIDGLRAIAVLAVVIFHLADRKLPGGFIGVDVFFVISGFLITRIVWQGLQQQQFSLATFYARRIKRLFPTLFVMLLFSSVIVAVIGIPQDTRDFGFAALSSVFYVSNLYFLSVSDYFNESLTINPLLHTWSLSVEEQFYLFLPLTLLLVHRFFTAALRRVLLALLLLSLGVGLWLSYHAESLAFFVSPTRFWQFLTGGLIAFITVPHTWQKTVMPVAVAGNTANAGHSRADTGRQS